MNNNFPLSEKYIDFINTTKPEVEFLEGTTASGKTTVGAGVKFMRKVSESNEKMHIIASQTTSQAEKNIINKENGILDLHKNAEYFGKGDSDNKLPHIKFEDKIIYILGHMDASRWKAALGGQYGCIFIDEVNTANIEFVREVFGRCKYAMCTLNPDNPNLPVYKEFINKSRPYEKYKNDVPKSILRELVEPENPLWKYWFFSFEDNKSLSKKDIERKKNNVPAGTKMYMNKILGLRCKATGVVFSNFDTRKHIINKKALYSQYKRNEIKFIQFTAGLDTAYSTNSPDTIAMIFAGITSKGEYIILDEKVYNNKELETPLAPSDTINELIIFLEKNRILWGLARNIFIDSADQATIQEAKKYKRNNPCIYVFNNAYKKIKIIDRIRLEIDMIHNNKFFICDTCTKSIEEHEVYSWSEKDDNTPEDANDHTINANQYAFIPYKDKIGINAKKILEEY